MSAAEEARELPPVPRGVRRNIAGEHAVDEAELEKKLGRIPFLIWSRLCRMRHPSGWVFTSILQLSRMQDCEKIAPLYVRKALRRLREAGLIGEGGWTNEPGPRVATRAGGYVYARSVFGSVPPRGSKLCVVPELTAEWLRDAAVWGGRREGAGRPRTSPNHRTRCGTLHRMAESRGSAARESRGSTFTKISSLSGLGDGASLREAAALARLEPSAVLSPSGSQRREREWRKIGIVFRDPKAIRIKKPRQVKAEIFLPSTPNPDATPTVNPSTAPPVVRGRFGFRLPPEMLTATKPAVASELPAIARSLVSTSPLGIRIGGKRAGAPLKYPARPENLRHPAVPREVFLAGIVAETPQPPRLHPANSRLHNAQLLARWYTGAMEAAFKTRCWTFKTAVEKHKHRALLEAAVDVFIELGISPVAWCAWSADIWKQFGKPTDKKPWPPATWVFGAKRIRERAGWFRHEAERYAGGRMVFTPSARELASKQSMMRAAVLRAPPDRVAAVVAHFFPPGEFDALLDAAKREAATVRDENELALSTGRWVW